MPVMTTPMPSEYESVRSTNPHIPSTRALIAAIAEALRQTGYGQLRSLELHCDGDSITIAGRVPSYFLKQFAQSTVIGVSGVRCVTNEVQVVSH